MYILCKRTPITTTSGVYNETELNDTQEQCVAHGYDSRNYSSRVIPKKKTSDASIKAQKSSSSTKMENKYVTAKTKMSASKDTVFVLRSTWNVVTKKGRGSMERTDTVEHGILCALALPKKMRVVVKDFTSEEDQHKALKDW